MPRVQSMKTQQKNNHHQAKKPNHPCKLNHFTCCPALGGILFGPTSHRRWPMSAPRRRRKGGPFRKCSITLRHSVPSCPSCHPVPYIWLLTIYAIWRLQSLTDRTEYAGGWRRCDLYYPFTWYLYRVSTYQSWTVVVLNERETAHQSSMLQKTYYKHTI